MYGKTSQSPPNVYLPVEVGQPGMRGNFRANLCGVRLRIGGPDFRATAKEASDAESAGRSGS
jgi:hypothetical protein